jgi:hypothetical protein
MRQRGFFYSFHPYWHHSKKGGFPAMKRIAILPLFFALGLIFVQPLQADTIAYTIQANMGLLSSLDPLGIGSGSGTATINFTVAPPPYLIAGNISTYYEELYRPVDLTLTLSGTNANGTHTNFSSSSVAFSNFFSSSNFNDEFMLGMHLQIFDRKYEFLVWLFLPLSFWSDSEEPPLPKLLSTSDVTDMYPICIIDETGIRPEPQYTFLNLQVTSQVVPVPPTIWLLGSGLLGLGGWRRFRKG